MSPESRLIGIAASEVDYGEITAQTISAVLVD
jgi:hypothetical protein